MLRALDALIESRIAAAQADGQFDDLPGVGRPLKLDDDRLVPEELRVAFRILRNAGLVPPEVERRRDIAALRQSATEALDRGDAQAERRARRRLFALTQALESRGVDLADPAWSPYAGSIRDRLMRD